jgi:hypothetical protein
MDLAFAAEQYAQAQAVAAVAAQYYANAANAAAINAAAINAAAEQHGHQVIRETIGIMFYKKRGNPCVTGLSNCKGKPVANLIKLFLV